MQQLKKQKRVKIHLALGHHSAARPGFFQVVFQPLPPITLPHPQRPNQPILTVVPAEHWAETRVEPGEITYHWALPGGRTCQKIFP